MSRTVYKTDQYILWHALPEPVIQAMDANQQMAQYLLGRGLIPPLLVRWAYPTAVAQMSAILNSGYYDPASPNHHGRDAPQDQTYTPPAQTQRQIAPAVDGTGKTSSCDTR